MTVHADMWSGKHRHVSCDVGKCTRNAIVIAGNDAGARARVRSFGWVVKDGKDVCDKCASCSGLVKLFKLLTG